MLYIGRADISKVLCNCTEYIQPVQPCLRDHALWDIYGHRFPYTTTIIAVVQDNGQALEGFVNLESPAVGYKSLSDVPMVDLQVSIHS
jgi:hypothetical protein